MGNTCCTPNQSDGAAVTQPRKRSPTMRLDSRDHTSVGCPTDSAVETSANTITTTPTANTATSGTTLSSVRHPVSGVPLVGSTMRTAPPRVSGIVRTDGNELTSVRPTLQMPSLSGSIRAAGGQRTSVTSPHQGDGGKSPLGKLKLLKASAFTSSLAAMSTPSTPLGASNPLSPHTSRTHGVSSGGALVRAIAGESHELPTFAPRLSVIGPVGGCGPGQYLAPDGSTTSASFASSSLTNRRYDQAVPQPSDDGDEYEMPFLGSPVSQGQHHRGSASQRNDDNASRVSFRDHALVLGEEHVSGIGSSGSDGEEDLDQQHQQQIGHSDIHSSGGYNSNGGRRSSIAAGYCDYRTPSQQQRGRGGSLPSMDGSVNSSTTECYSVSSAVSLASSMCEEMGLNLSSGSALNSIAVPLVDDGNFGKNRHSRQIARKRKHQQRSLSKASSNAAGASLRNAQQQPQEALLQVAAEPPLRASAVSDHGMSLEEFCSEEPTMFSCTRSAAAGPLPCVVSVCTVGATASDGIVLELLAPTLSTSPMDPNVTVVDSLQHHRQHDPGYLDSRSPPCQL